MRHRVIRFAGVVLGAAVVVAVVAACAAAGQVRSAPPTGTAARQPAAGDGIRVEVEGAFSKASGGGFQITAAGVTWGVDASADRQLMDAAERLAGKAAVVRGTYVERSGAGGLRGVVKARRLEPAPEGGRGEYVEVTVRGTMRTGVMAIGAETTGVTITSGTVTWELESSGDQRDAAERLSGSKVVVTGQLRRVGGVEIRSRFIVRVRSIQAA